MGTLTLSRLIGEVRSGLLERTDVADQAIVDSLNFAQTQLSRFHDFMELKRTADSKTLFTLDATKDQYLAVPKRLKVVHTFRLLDGYQSRKLRERPWREFDKKFPDPPSRPRGKPRWYSRWGELFMFVPVPDAVYPVRMKYTRDPEPFVITNPNQLSDYEEKDDILIYLALEHRWYILGRHDRGDKFGQLAAVNMKLAKDSDDERPDMDTHPQGLDAGYSGEYWNDPWIRSVETD